MEKNVVPPPNVVIVPVDPYKNYSSDDDSDYESTDVSTSEASSTVSEEADLQSIDEPVELIDGLFDFVTLTTNEDVLLKDVEKNVDQFNLESYITDSDSHTSSSSSSPTQPPPQQEPQQEPQSSDSDNKRERIKILSNSDQLQLQKSANSIIEKMDTKLIKIIKENKPKILKMESEKSEPMRNANAVGLRSPSQQLQNIKAKNSLPSGNAGGLKTSSQQEMYSTNIATSTDVYTVVPSNNGSDGDADLKMVIKKISENKPKTLKMKPEKSVPIRNANTVGLRSPSQQLQNIKAKNSLPSGNAGGLKTSPQQEIYSTNIAISTDIPTAVRKISNQQSFNRKRSHEPSYNSSNGDAASKMVIKKMKEKKPDVLKMKSEKSVPVRNANAVGLRSPSQQLQNIKAKNSLLSGNAGGLKTSPEQKIYSTNIATSKDVPTAVHKISNQQSFNRKRSHEPSYNSSNGDAASKMVIKKMKEKKPDVLKMKSEKSEPMRNANAVGLRSSSQQLQNIKDKNSLPSGNAGGLKTSPQQEIYSTSIATSTDIPTAVRKISNQQSFNRKRSHEPSYNSSNGDAASKMVIKKMKEKKPDVLKMKSEKSVPVRNANAVGLRSPSQQLQNIKAKNSLLSGNAGGLKTSPEQKIYSTNIATSKDVPTAVHKISNQQSFNRKRSRDPSNNGSDGDANIATSTDVPTAVRKISIQQSPSDGNADSKMVIKKMDEKKPNILKMESEKCVLISNGNAVGLRSPSQQLQNIKAENSLPSGNAGGLKTSPQQENSTNTVTSTDAPTAVRKISIQEYLNRKRSHETSNNGSDGDADSKIKLKKRITLDEYRRRIAA